MRIVHLAAVLAAVALSGCEGAGLVPYHQSPDTVIASARDTGTDAGTMQDGHAAIAYDPDGCQGWIMDDGVEGYSGRRFDPATGLPVCDGKYPPGTVLGNYRQHNMQFQDWVPAK
jgi:hypothetical protein